MMVFGMSEHGLEKYTSSLILIMVTKDKSIYSESQGTSTMSTEKLFTFVCLAHW